MSIHVTNPVALPVKALPSEFSYWRWSLRDEPRLALAAILPVSLLGCATALLTSSASATILVIVALMLASWQVFLPIRYTFDAQGIERRLGPWCRRIAWNAIGSWDASPAGVRIFQASKPTSLDALASIFVPWGMHKPAVLAVLRKRTVLLPVTRSAAASNQSVDDETATAVEGLGRPVG